MLKIIQQRKIWFALSGILVIASLAAVFTYGLNLGKDFNGGSLLEVAYDNGQPTAEMEKRITDAGIEDFKVQPAGDNSHIIRLESIDENKHQELLATMHGELDSNNYIGFTELRFESIGPTIGQELKRKAIYATILVLVCIILYIAYTFRKVSTKIPSWKFGVCAIVALFHDIIIVLGAFAIFGKFFDVQLDSLFVIALLTVLGYSVNDSIVVFDRIRYNILNESNKSFNNTVELSLNQTLTRSLNTSITTLLVLTALALFGGATIQWFILALIVGVIAGTYSSIFVASPALVEWEKRTK